MSAQHKWLTPDDLAPFTAISDEQAHALIKQAEGMAITFAPCLGDEPTEAQTDAVRGILVTAVVRWHEAGSGAVTQASRGPFSGSINPRVRRGLFWPSEVRELQRICRPAAGKAHMIDLVQTQDEDIFATRPDLRFQFG